MKQQPRNRRIRWSRRWSAADLHAQQDRQCLFPRLRRRLRHPFRAAFRLENAGRPVYYYLFSDMLKDGRFTVRFSTGPAFNFGPNIVKKGQRTQAPKEVECAADSNFRRETEARLEPSPGSKASGLRAFGFASLAGGRDEAHRPFRQRADRQAGIHAQVGRDHRAVANVHILVAEQAIPANPLRRPPRTPAIGQPPRMCAVPGTSKRISVTMLSGVPPIACAIRAGELVRLRNKRRDPPPVAPQHPPEGPEPRAAQRISMWPSSVCMQSRMMDSRAQPNGCRQRTVRKGWRSRDPTRFLSQSRMRVRPGPSAGQHRRQQAHRVGPAG